MSKAKTKNSSVRFESVQIDSIYPVLDAISWLNLPDIKQIAQFSALDPRTVGKILKNISMVELINQSGDQYSLAQPYPYKGTPEQKDAVIREAMLRMSLVVNLKQFCELGDNTEVALRKAATVVGIQDFKHEDLAPLLKWIRALDLFNSTDRVEDLVDKATNEKADRHQKAPKEIVGFLSHSSVDKAFVRKLAGDLKQQEISVWLDEQRILVGDSIAEKIGQGLAESDFFLIVLTPSSVGSEWVKKELNRALLAEIERREVVILPIKMGECEIPELIKEKKYADFTTSYKEGFVDLVTAMKSRRT
jgi:hypothetical protein